MALLCNVPVSVHARLPCEFTAGAVVTLQPVSAATTVRLRNGKVSITDGPFAETNEQIGGFILIEAKDLNEAIQIASKIPVIRLGAIEVRPIMELVASSGK